MDILILSVIACLVVAVILLAFRNRDLARGQRIWMQAACNNRAAAAPPMPQAAETIKLSNFQRVLDQRDASSDANRELTRQLRDARLELRESDETIRLLSEQSRRLERELSGEKKERERLAGLYKEADLERQRLRLENGRLAKERLGAVN